MKPKSRTFERRDNTEDIFNNNFKPDNILFPLEVREYASFGRSKNNGLQNGGQGRG